MHRDISHVVLARELEDARTIYRYTISLHALVLMVPGAVIKGACPRGGNFFGSESDPKDLPEYIKTDHQQTVYETWKELSNLVLLC